MKLKDNVRTYILIFIVIFSCLSLIYVCLDTADIDELNRCLETNTFEYCNEVVR